MKSVLKVLTANRLSDGIAVWYAAPQKWVEDVTQAKQVSDKEGIAALEAVAAETIAKGQYCDVVFIDVEEADGSLRPVKLRERIRADGPTIRLDLGKQAERDVRAA
jgi:Protein of unknown function (DUF2849)